MDEVDDDFPLHEAAAEGFREECERLISSAGKDVNLADQLGWTPLMHAIHNRHILIAKDLLSRGANVDIKNHHGVTVFTIAVLGCDENLLTTLYHSLAEPELQQNESNNGLQILCIFEIKRLHQLKCALFQIASLRGVYSAARWLLTNTNVDINLVSPLTGVAPLHLAVIGQHDKVAELLIHFGADPTITNALGQDVFKLATKFGNRRIYQLLYKNVSPMQEIFFNFNEDIAKRTFDYIDPQYTCNNIYLDLQEDVNLKNSPCRPVFKTSKNDSEFEQANMFLMSPSLRSVFLLSPQSNGKLLNQSSTDQDRNLHALISPRVYPPNSPGKSLNRGKKRKLTNGSGCSSWLKRLTKRQSRSVDDDLQNADNCEEEDSFNFDLLKPNGIDLSHLLFSLGLQEYFPTFREHELDIWTLLTMTKEDLDEMGIINPESQTLILNRIQILKNTQL